MFQQVHLSPTEACQMLTHKLSNSELFIWLKGYILGYLGISLDDEAVYSIMNQVETNQEFVEVEMISRENAIRIIMSSLEKMPNRKVVKPTDIDKNVKTFQEYIQFFDEEVLGNSNYFEDKLKEMDYSHKGMFGQEFLLDCECQICTTNLNPEDSIFLECSHIFHHECLHQHVKATVDAGTIVVKCPNQKCGIEMSNLQLMNLMTPQVQIKYNNFTMSRYVQNNGACTSWCPTPDCNLVFEFEPDITLFDCRNCKKRYCLKCRCDYHENMTCEENKEYQGMNEEDKSFVNCVRGAKFKQCPRCKFWVQRNQGCPSMKCRCGQDFCYECGGVTCPHGICSKNPAAGLRMPSLAGRTELRRT